MENEYDIVIVGCGPAGLSAAINAKARNKSVLVAGGEFCSPKLHNSPRIDNYLGLPAINGEALRQRFLEHVQAAKVPIETCKVTSVFPQEGGFLVQTDREQQFSARALVLTLGVMRQTALTGEKEYLGKGVSYCATCDAMFFRGKRVAVVAYEKGAEEEAQLLSETCEKVYYLPQYQDAVGEFGDNVEIINAKPTAVKGEKIVEFLEIGQEHLEVNGIFIIRESVPVEQLVPGIQLSGRFIQVDASMATTVPGVFAGGDCVGEPLQLAKAVGQGQVAALSAAKYLS